MKYFLLLLLWSLGAISLVAQTSICQELPWDGTNLSGMGVYTAVGIEVPNTVHQKVNYSVDETRLQFRLGLEENGVYPYGKGDVFDLVVTLSAKIKDATGVVVQSINGTLQLRANQPEAVYQVVLNNPAVLEGVDPYNLGSSNALYSVEDITINYNFAAPNITPTWVNFRNNLRFRICHTMDLRTDVGSTTVGFIPLNSNILALATQPAGMPYYAFKWAAESQVTGLLDRATFVPHYEFQLLKLENTLLEAADRVHERHIKTAVDWDKALSFVLPEEKLRDNGRYKLLFKPSEGTGYYLWRVRSIGNYFEGGVAQNQNWGTWSAPNYPVVNGILELQAPSSFDCFYYEDKEANDNYLYNRLFTEDGQVYESTTYADKLLRPRQSQTYLPADSVNGQGQTVVGQTLYDHLGRSSISVIPVPVEGYMNGYKEKLVTTDNGELYTLEDYGVDGTIYNPATISDTGVYRYYSENNNEDVTIPSAQGYPFTRTIYSQDGLNRVREQSGIGKTHMVGPRSAGRGRTTTTDVQVGVTDVELVSIFGLEAPHPDHVVKQVVTDPNGTNSVTYTSKSGKTLATALSEPYEPNSSTYPLLPLDQASSNTIQLNEVMGLGAYGKGAFINNKSILLTQGTSNMTITYKAPGCVAGTGSNLPACLAPAFQGCSYTVELTIRGEANSTNIGQAPYFYTATQQVSGCATYTFVTLPYLPAGTYHIEKRVSIDNNNLATLIDDYKTVVELQMSNYMALIGRLLDQVNQPSDWGTVDLAVDAIHNYLTTTNRDAAAQAILATALNGHFNNAFQNFDFTTLNAATGNFGEVVLGMTYEATLDTSQTGLTDQVFDQILLVVQNCEGNPTNLSSNIDRTTAPFTFGRTAPYNYQPNGYNQGAIDYAYPPFVEYFVDQVGGNLYDSTEFAVLDSTFWGYKYWAIGTGQWVNLDRQFVIDYRQALAQNDKDKLQLLNANQFNRMIWHMLNDEYYTGQVRFVNNQYEYFVDSSSTWTAYLPDRASLEEPQYNAGDLTDCWKGLVGSYANMVLFGDNLQPSLDLDSLVNASPDADFQDDLMCNIPWIIRFFFGNQLDDAMTNTANQNSNGVQPFGGIEIAPLHLPKQLLNCVGTRYARLIEPKNEADARTLARGSLAFNTYDVPLLGDPSSAAQSVSIGSNGYTKGSYTIPGYADELAEYYGVGERQDFAMTHESHTITALPYVQNPIFAFKYYEYWGRNAAGSFGHPWNGESNNAGTQTLQLGQLDRPYSCLACEQTYAYEEDLDLNSCAYSTIGHDQWNAARRANFFNCILTINNDYPFPENARVTGSRTIKMDEQCATTSTKMQEEVDTLVSRCRVACEDRREEFRREVIDMFERACWEVGQCSGQTNNYVSLAEIEIVVDSLVAECGRQCDSSALDVPQSSPATCTSTLPGMNNGLIIEYCEVADIGVCMRRLQEIAQYWKLELHTNPPNNVTCPGNTWEDPQPNSNDTDICIPATGGVVDPLTTRTPTKVLSVPNN